MINPANMPVTRRNCWDIALVIYAWTGATCVGLPRPHLRDFCSKIALLWVTGEFQHSRIAKQGKYPAKWVVGVMAPHGRRQRSSSRWWCGAVDNRKRSLNSIDLQI